MYNLSVAEAHTFYVGEGHWLVHNAKCPSKELADNLLDIGDTKNPYDAAHHIVPHKDGRYFGALESRDILNRYGVDLNSANNGVFLPPSYHTSSLHTKDQMTKYYAEVYRRLSEVEAAGGTKADIIATLQGIKADLKAGKKW